ncbi:beta-ketoacyl-[acyl-carrier-protein] synthase family protein [Thiohalomonas denitrificans]|uniref:beta-ketoacyl-[acyl-carrier-protein] synthase family protein n=1 Tax=Thiohalomonas denitrificans TaxID=415747 RepID=UPI0026EA613B|nr:beta-ketoacyl-[acyl-carrier-protein] synthase family protein [Thiohalomonas denitrificans]
MKPLLFTAYTTLSAAGEGSADLCDALLQRRGGLRSNDFEHSDLNTWIGRVDGLEESPVSAALSAFDCRNNRLAERALALDGFAAAVSEARARYGSDRIGVFIGTSTSGILETELAYQRRDAEGRLPASYSYRHSHDLFSITDFVRRYLDLDGPAFAVSTACSSSAKVFADARRFISAGFCDAAVVGGVDSLCLTTLYGFNSLELVSTSACRPFAPDRSGISIGEAAGFVLLERPKRDGVALLGYGESSDAHHMSTPHPEGAGAALAMKAALARAGMDGNAVDYVNLHGTATQINDSAEDTAVSSILGDVPCSSTKGWTGHTLGAAGITEAIISAMAIERGFLPGTLNTGEKDPALKSRLLLENEKRRVERVMTNSFGFGGNNCSLLLGQFSC